MAVLYNRFFWRLKIKRLMLKSIVLMRRPKMETSAYLICLHQMTQARGLNKLWQILLVTPAVNRVSSTFKFSYVNIIYIMHFFNCFTDYLSIWNTFYFPHFLIKSNFSTVLHILPVVQNIVCFKYVRGFSLSS